MNSDSTISTYTNVPVNVLCPKEEHFVPRDIAHALSLLCRANGHIKQFYSVAQHSLNCLLEARERNLSPRIQLACLIHDVSEAYLSDIIRPIKILMPEYMILEKKVQQAIYNRFGLGELSEEEAAVLSEIDDCALYYEFFHLHISGGAKIKKPEIYSGKMDFSLKEPPVVEEEFYNELTRFDMRTVYKI